MEEELNPQSTDLMKVQTVLKHRNRLLELRENKSRHKIVQKKALKEKKGPLKSIIQRPEEFVHSYITKQKNYAHYLLRKRKPVDSDLETGSVIFIIRVIGDKNLSTNQKNILRKLKLSRRHEGNFYIVDDQLLSNLKRIENMVLYGKINRKTLGDLISKRGFIKINAEMKSLNSNKIIEDILGKFGIICIEDILAEIYGKGNNVKEIKKVLSTFKLTKPTEGYGNKFKPKSKGGAWGYWGDSLNKLLKEMF